MRADVWDCVGVGPCQAVCGLLAGCLCVLGCMHGNVCVCDGPCVCPVASGGSGMWLTACGAWGGLCGPAAWVFFSTLCNQHYNINMTVHHVGNQPVFCVPLA